MCDLLGVHDKGHALLDCPSSDLEELQTKYQKRKERTTLTRYPLFA